MKFGYATVDGHDTKKKKSFMNSILIAPNT